VIPTNSAVVVTDETGGVLVEVSLGNADQGLLPLLDVQYSDTVLLSQTVGTDQVRSAPVDITLVNQQTELTSAATICLGVSNSTSTSGNVGDYCLGYIDESTNPPQWKCEDLCLQEKNGKQFCGQTPHFTNFAVLLMGNGDKNKKKNGVCQSSSGNDTNYITGSGWGDGVLTIVSIVAVFLVMAILGLILFTTPCGRRIALGKEGVRVADLRKRARTTTIEH
jgi:hypothetical protein